MLYINVMLDYLHQNYHRNNHKNYILDFLDLLVVDFLDQLLLVHQYFDLNYNLT